MRLFVFFDLRGMLQYSDWIKREARLFSWYFIFSFRFPIFDVYFFILSRFIPAYVRPHFPSIRRYLIISPVYVSYS